MNVGSISNRITVELDALTLQLLREFASQAGISVEKAAERAIRSVMQELLIYSKFNPVDRETCAKRGVEFTPRSLR